MLRPFVVLGLVAVALTAPHAQAQFSTSMALLVAPAEEALVEGGRLVLSGTMVFTADQLAMLNTNGIPLKYSVVGAPAWATVTVSPSSDLIPVNAAPGPYVSWTATRVFSIVVDGDLDGIDGDVGLIEIAAVATPTAPQGRPTSAQTTIPVRFDAVDEPCDLPHETVAAPAATPIEDEASKPVVIQSSAATPLAMPLAAVAGFGAVGAGVGLLVRRRLR